MPRWLKRATILVIGAPILGVAVWYSVSFLPYLGELKEISSRGRASVKDVESVLYPLAVASESKEGLRSYAARQAYYSLVYEKNPVRMFAWHANNLLWYSATFFHFNDQETFGIWAQCALSGCGQGLNEIAQRYFGKELVSFSERELAGLVAVVRSPTRFAPGTEAGEKRTNEILERAKTHNTAINADSERWGSHGS
ncbi:MAG TPA: hypothetical protein VGD24_01585 [Gallionella sp.]